jgi:purine-binding chemotaxis protein CheW
MLETRKLCAFTLGGELFGIEVERVQEVLRHQPMTRVPLASAAIGGLINLRGEVVTAIDLRGRMGLPARAGELPMNVVLRVDGGALSLLVDGIVGVVDVTGDACKEPPATLDEPARAFVRGVYQLPDRLLALLDVERAVDAGAGAALVTGQGAGA